MIFWGFWKKPGREAIAIRRNGGGRQGLRAPSSQVSFLEEGGDVGRVLGAAGPMFGLTQSVKLSNYLLANCQ